MKKTCTLLIVMLLVLSIGIACADTYEKPILFRGINWGATRSDAAKGLPEGIKMYDTKIGEYWHTVDNWMYDESLDDYYKAELGCYEYARSSSVENVKVAGYNIDNMYLHYAYLPGEDGILVKDDSHTALIYAYYKLEPKDPDAVYSDLVNKLTSLYGDVDLHQQKAPYISYEQNLWNGADGTMVSLVRQDYPSGSHYIFIKYGYRGADELLANAYNAVVLEETLNAASNTDGL